MHSALDSWCRHQLGCPIRVRLDHRSLAAPQPRFAALRALLRHLAPRHPPYTLLRLARSFTLSLCIYTMRTNRLARTSFEVCDPRFDLVRFGKIEVNLRFMNANEATPSVGHGRDVISRSCGSQHSMWLFKCCLTRATLLCAGIPLPVAAVCVPLAVASATSAWF